MRIWSLSQDATEESHYWMVGSKLTLAFMELEIRQFASAFSISSLDLAASDRRRPAASAFSCSSKGTGSASERCLSLLLFCMTGTHSPPNNLIPAACVKYADRSSGES